MSAVWFVLGACAGITAMIWLDLYLDRGGDK